MYNDELMHFGIKGMKWGVRRYQNKDGTLTAAGKKRISKEYKELSDKVENKLNKDYSKRYMNSWNKAADTMNNGGIDKFNKEQKAKYGDNYAKRDGYESDYYKVFETELVKNYNKSLKEFYQTDADYKKVEALVKKYDMTKWDELAKEHVEAVKSVYDAVKD